jgi:ribonuclease BN (tRNA processing enzyme)
MMIAGVLAASHAANAQVPATSDSKTSLVLLGTGGGPGGLIDRAGISSLVRVQGKNYLVDAGEGVSRQLARAGIAPMMAEREIPVVFLTHLHDDHTAGLPSLMSFAYTLRAKGMEIIGPPQTNNLVQGALAFLQPNAEIRRAEQGLPRTPAEMFSAREMQPGLIYSDENIRVTAIENTHYHFTSDAESRRHRSYSLRFETPDRVIVFTGDTTASDAVVELAQGADILISEIASFEDSESVPPPVRAHMEKEHLSPTQVGQLAAAAKVKTVVLSHMRKVSQRDLTEIQRHFSGPVVIGEDLQRF